MTQPFSNTPYNTSLWLPLETLQEQRMEYFPPPSSSPPCIRTVPWSRHLFSPTNIPQLNAAHHNLSTLPHSSLKPLSISWDSLHHNPKPYQPSMATLSTQDQILRRMSLNQSNMSLSQSNKSLNQSNMRLNQSNKSLNQSNKSLNQSKNQNSYLKEYLILKKMVMIN